MRLTKTGLHEFETPQKSLCVQYCSFSWCENSIVLLLHTVSFCFWQVSHEGIFF